jgi:hypothetical protein
MASARFYVLINGSPSGEFNYERGLSQGDPLSPFIFILAMEALSSFISSALKEGILSGIKLPNGGSVLSHLIFADDVLLMGDLSESNARNLARLIRGFSLVSGLNINRRKSCVYGVGGNPGENNSLANILGCQTGSLPFVYLGIGVGANMNKISNWDPVIESFGNRLALWKA